MADLSLDDYIKNRKIKGKKPGLMTSKNAKPQAGFHFSPVKFNEKQKPANGGIKNRLGSKSLITKKKLGNIQGIDARSKITIKNRERVKDAREKILEKTKFVDARHKIQNNLAKKQSNSPVKKPNLPKVTIRNQTARPNLITVSRVDDFSAPILRTVPTNAAPQNHIQRTIGCIETSAPLQVTRFIGNPGQEHFQPTSYMDTDENGAVSRPIQITRRLNDRLQQPLPASQPTHTTYMDTMPVEESLNVGLQSRSAINSQPNSGLYSRMLNSQQVFSNIPSQHSTVQYTRTVGNNTIVQGTTTAPYAAEQNFIITRPLQQEYQPVQHVPVVEPEFKQAPRIRIQNDQYCDAPTPSATSTSRVTTSRVTTSARAKAAPVTMKSHKAAVKELKKDIEEPEYISPFQGFKVLVTNLHPIVTQDDIIELFGSIGQLKKARLLKKGLAEIIYHEKESAVLSVKKYNGRELDGSPMIVKMVTPMNAKVKKDDVEGVIKQIKPTAGLKPLEHVELDMDAVQKALFKVSSRTTDSPAPKPVSFTVKI